MYLTTIVKINIIIVGLPNILIKTVIVLMLSTVFIKYKNDDSGMDSCHN